MGLPMRRRLRKFLPIVLMALAVQFFAPIVACWAAGIGASNPLLGSSICRDDGASSSNSTGPSDQPCARDGCCAACSLAYATPVGTPPATTARLDLQPERVVWREVASDQLQSRTGSHAQARAPPQLT
jgi:hypothetical protein